MSVGDKSAVEAILKELQEYPEGSYMRCGFCGTKHANDHSAKCLVNRLTAALVARASGLPPMNDDLGDILGRPNFTCVSIANLLRFNGQSIPQKAEDEQASCIYFLLDLYLKHGESWREKGAKEILGEKSNDRRAKAAADGTGEKKC